MTLKRWEEVINEDFPHIEEVTRTMVQASARQMLLYPGCARLATGRLSTTKELEDRREEAMRPLYEEEYPAFQPYKEPALTTRVYDYIVNIFYRR